MVSPAGLGVDDRIVNDALEAACVKLRLAGENVYVEIWFLLESRAMGWRVTAVGK
jgi:hypothetical protein